MKKASISTDASVDTRSSVGRYIGGVSTDVSTDTPIGRYIWRFTDTAPSVLVDIGIYISVDTSVDTRPTLDRSINDISTDRLVDISFDM